MSSYVSHATFLSSALLSQLFHFCSLRWLHVISAFPLPITRLHILATHRLVCLISSYWHYKALWWPCVFRCTIAAHRGNSDSYQVFFSLIGVDPCHHICLNVANMSGSDCLKYTTVAYMVVSVVSLQFTWFALCNSMCLTAPHWNGSSSLVSNFCSLVAQLGPRFHTAAQLTGSVLSYTSYISLEWLGII